MKITKHYGKIASTNQVILLLFTEVPDEPENCLYVPWDAISLEFQNEIATVANTTYGRNYVDLGIALSELKFDNIDALNLLHSRGLIKKTAQTNVMMEILPDVTIRLDILVNELKKIGNMTTTLNSIQVEATDDSKVMRMTQTNVVATDTPTVEAQTQTGSVEQQKVMELEQKFDAVSQQVASLADMMQKLMSMTIQAQTTTTE